MALLKKGNRLTKKDVAKSCEHGPLGFFFVKTFWGVFNINLAMLYCQSIKQYS